MPRIASLTSQGLVGIAIPRVSFAFSLYSTGGLEVLEGQTQSFIAVTPSSVVNGTTLYWTATGHTTLASSGSFTVSGASGSFTVTPSLDGVSLGPKTLTVDLRSDSTSGPILATTDVTVRDNSTQWTEITAAPITMGGSLAFIAGTDRLLGCYYDSASITELWELNLDLNTTPVLVYGFSQLDGSSNIRITTTVQSELGTQLFIRLDTTGSALWSLWRSTDAGRTVTEVIANSTTYINTPVWYGGQNWAVTQGNLGISLSADDGATWSSPVALAGITSYNPLFYGNGVWIMVSTGSGDNLVSYGYSSTGPENISLVSGPSHPQGGYLNGFVVANGRFFTGSGSSHTGYFYSTDGLNWSYLDNIPATDTTKGKLVSGNSSIVYWGGVYYALCVGTNVYGQGTGDWYICYTTDPTLGWTKTINLANLPNTTNSQYTNLKVSNNGWLAAVSATLGATKIQVAHADVYLAPTYAIAASSVYASEGTGLQFTITTTNVADGTALYWTASLPSDFAYASGTVTMINNNVAFNLTPTLDQLTEGPETFTVSLRTGSISGPVVATTSTVTIADTSVAPQLMVERVSNTVMSTVLPAGVTESSLGYQGISPSLTFVSTANTYITRTLTATGFDTAKWSMEAVFRPNANGVGSYPSIAPAVVGMANGTERVQFSLDSNTFWLHEQSGTGGGGLSNQLAVSYGDWYWCKAIKNEAVFGTSNVRIWLYNLSTSTWIANYQSFRSVYFGVVPNNFYAGGNPANVNARANMDLAMARITSTADMTTPTVPFYMPLSTSLVATDRFFIVGEDA